MNARALVKHGKVLDRLKAVFVPGKVYRRTELCVLSTNVDRHLSSLVKEGVLKKINHGLYLCPKKTTFGEALPDENSLVQAFLKDDRFVIYSFNTLNSLGLGTTQLYTKRVVFNRKRTGEFNLGGRIYVFHRWREAPIKISREFLVVELLNRLNELSEDREKVLENLKKNLPLFNLKKLKFALSHYGTHSAQLKFSQLQMNKEAFNV